MAYRFTNSASSSVEFALGPFSGYTIGAYTIAVLLKRTVSSAFQAPFFVSNSVGSTMKSELRLANTAFAQAFMPPAGGIVMAETMNAGTWYLFAVTGTGSGTTARSHIQSGGAWAHSASPTTAGSASIVAGDRLFASPPAAWGGEYMNGDVVCIGFKKANSTDLAIETLSYTSFPAWSAFGFDWLIGYETSSSLVNRANPGSGDETSRAGVSVVADPSGWSWVTVTTPVANFTGTPLTGTEPLSVAFTDSSTNTPTSWAWTFGDGGTSTSQNPTHSYATAGTFTVALTATNSAGSNTLTRTGYVVVADQPRPVRINTSQGWVDIGDATSFVSGSGAPTVAAGATGAIYLDSSSGRMYGPKAAGAWPATALGGITGASGTTGARPGSVPVGYGYFDTTLGKPVWWNGSVWKDATGTTV